MQLEPGARLGPYEILASIGAGGMGEVYRARDPRLQRVVAIKVLPSTFAADRDRLRRFEQEARAAAAIDHPNVTAVYDVGSHTPSGSAGSEGVVPYLVTELLDGRTLADRLRRGALPISKAVEYSRQILSGLAAAHARGIVHRDLKPSNVFVTTDERVKILDFGVTKLTEPTADEARRASTVATRVGALVGTVGYMSPEQVRGHDVDARSDLFAVGVILYEMLARAPAFRGETDADTLSQILSEDPAELPAAERRISPALVRIVHRCLEKAPASRFQTASDLAFALEGASLVSGTSSPGDVARQPGSSIVAEFVRRHRRRVGLAALTLVAAVASLVALLPDAQRDPSAPAAFSLIDADIVRLTATGNAYLPAISPDGRWVAFVQRDGEDESLWVRQTVTASNQRIVPAQPGVRIAAPTVTPDGNYVDYITITEAPREYRLWRVPFLGGPPRPLADDVHSGIGWSPDGRQMVFVRRGLAETDNEPAQERHLVIADSEGRDERVLAQSRPDAVFFSLDPPAGGPGMRVTWSPDGAVIALPGAGFPGGTLTGYAMFIAVSDGSVLAALPQTPPGGLAWIDSVSLLQARSTNQGGASQLWRLEYPSGEVSRLTNDLDGYTQTTLVAGGARFAAVRQEELIDIWIGDPDGGGGRDVVSGARTLFGGGGSGHVLAWAGERLLYTAGTPDDLSIFALRPDEGTTEEIVRGAAGPGATPDGGTIVYLSMVEATLSSLWRADADGRGPELLAPAAGFPRVAPDGRQVLYGTQGTWIVPIDGGKPTRIMDLSGLALDVSPDGRRLVAMSGNDAGTLEIVVCELPACDGQRRLAPSGLVDPFQRGSTLRFTPEGDGIAYVNVTSEPNVWVQAIDGSTPWQLTRFTDGRDIYDFAWSHDGERLAVAHGTFRSDIVLFTVPDAGSG